MLMYVDYFVSTSAGGRKSGDPAGCCNSELSSIHERWVNVCFFVGPAARAVPRS